MKCKAFLWTVSSVRVPLTVVQTTDAHPSRDKTKPLYMRTDTSGGENILRLQERPEARKAAKPAMTT